jgi:hypothetical protein
MDGAKAPHLYRTVSAEPRSLTSPDAETSRKVAGVARKALGVNLAGAALGADLGGSSKYSREALEDRCGEGFRVNSR